MVARSSLSVALKYSQIGGRKWPVSLWNKLVTEPVCRGLCGPTLSTCSLCYFIWLLCVLSVKLALFTEPTDHASVPYLVA